MDPTLAVLISDLKTQSPLSFQGEQLPDEKIVMKIGETANLEAIPPLEEALLRAQRIKILCENLQSRINSGAATSASPFLTAMLAEQSMRAINKAITRCQPSGKSNPLGPLE